MQSQPGSWLVNHFRLAPTILIVMIQVVTLLLIPALPSPCLGQDASHSEQLFKAGVSSLLAGDNKGAIALFSRHLKITPRDGDALYYLAQAYHLSGDNELALKSIRECLRLQPTNPAVWQKYGELLCSSGDNQAALPWLLKAQRADPTLERIDFDLGVANYNDSNYQAAATYAAKSVKAAPNNLRALTLLASAQVKLSRWAEAEANLKRVLATNTEDTASLLSLGHCELELQNYAAAIGTLQQVLKQDPTQILAHFYLSRAFAGTGQIEEAQHQAELHNRMMEQVSFARPGAEAAREQETWQQARQLLEQNHEDQALQLFRQSSMGVPSSEAGAYVLVGAVYLSIGKTPEAQQRFLHAIELNPKIRGARTYLGIISLQQADLDAAEMQFNEELANDPNYQMAIAEIGEIRYRQQRWSEAAEQLSRSKTTIPAMLYMLCDSYFHLGRVSDANLTAETLAAYARNQPEILQGLVDLLSRNQQTGLASHLAQEAAN